MITAIICAAGKGSRAHFTHNKLFEEFEHVPVIVRTVCAFLACNLDEILVACAPEEEERMQALLPYPTVRTVHGGNTRSESVYLALQQAKGEIVLVHDGARPFVSEQTVADCIESVKAYGSGVCALPVTDTVVYATDGKITQVPERENVFAVQTPQGFYREELLAAYERAFADNRTFTDDSGVYAAYCKPPRLFFGNRENRKLTFVEDFAPAGNVGFGVDTHAFGEAGEFITLGGVRVPCDRKLVAHSDGDALVHALMDALLSANGMRDIGHYFPDTDEKYRNADSTQLLQRVITLLREEGKRVRNVSISVLAETPRLAKYIDSMKKTLAPLLGIAEKCIGIAAGTNEQLGYVGEKKGITVYAYVCIQDE